VQVTLVDRPTKPVCLKKPFKLSESLHACRSQSSSGKEFQTIVPMLDDFGSAPDPAGGAYEVTTYPIPPSRLGRGTHLPHSPSTPSASRSGRLRCYSFLPPPSEYKFLIPGLHATHPVSKKFWHRHCMARPSINDRCAVLLCLSWMHVTPWHKTTSWLHRRRPLNNLQSFTIR